MAVDIFLFLSGLCLTLSADKHCYAAIKGGWKQFYLSRFKRIIPPYVIICVPYYIYRSVVEATGGPVRRVLAFLANFSSATFWLKGTQTTWYVYAIAFLYLIFPLLYPAVKKGSRLANIALLGGVIVLAFLSEYIPVVNNTVIFWTRVPIFMIGIMAADKKWDCFDRTHSGWAIAGAAIALIGIGGFISVDEVFDIFQIPQNIRLLLYIPCVLAIIILRSNVKETRHLKVLELAGTISLEIYLVHIVLLHPMKDFGLLELLGNWTYIILPVIAFFLALLVQKIDNLILKER